MATYAEQVQSWEQKLTANLATMKSIMDKSADEGATLDAAQKEEYDELVADNVEIEDHLKRLRPLLKQNLATAKAVNAGDEAEASASRAPGRVVTDVRRNVEKGIIFTRCVGAKYLAYKHQVSPIDVARSKFSDTPEVEMILKAPVAPMNTTDSVSAAPLVELQNATAEFIELLRPQTIIGRIPGLRNVPFNISVPRGTGDPTAYWVGQGKVKPVSSMTFDTVTLTFSKVAGIVVQTEELMRFSTPSSEMLIRDGLVSSVAYLTDRDFLDPNKAADDISPASVTNGVSPITSSGTTADALRADIGALLDEYEDDNIGGDSLVLVMTRKQAGRLSLMRNALGQQEFPGITRAGGTLEGIPVITSNNIVSSTGSPADGGLIVAINAGSILLADDGGIQIDVSREASLQMDSAPDSPATASTVMTSLWQTNHVAFRAERYIRWVKARPGAVQFITGAKYTG